MVESDPLESDGVEDRGGETGNETTAPALTSGSTILAFLLGASAEGAVAGGVKVMSLESFKVDGNGAGHSKVGDRDRYLGADKASGSRVIRR